MSMRGVRIVGHGGDTFWFHTLLALFPEYDLGLFVSYNTQEGAPGTGRFLEAFVERYFPGVDPLPDPPLDFTERAGRYEGTYRANRFSHSTVAKVAALVGGVLSAVAGTGANLTVFVVLVVVLGVDVRRALPTSVAVMATVSVVGLVVVGLIDGQLDVVVVGDRVVAVGGDPVGLPSARADVVAMWLAALPVVMWGAPLGAWVASRVDERALVGAVAALATVEVVSTCAVVGDLRGSASMLAATISGIVVVPSVVVALRARWGTGRVSVRTGSG